jgi:uncharacterized RDD family membrane protein YckC
MRRSPTGGQGDYPDSNLLAGVDGGANGQRFASWGRRLIGYVLDGVIIGVPSLILSSLTPNRPGIVTAVRTFILLASVAYAAILISLQGRTLGMRICSLAVVDAKTKQPVNPRAAWIRSVVATALVLPVFILGVYSRNQSANWNVHHHAIVTVVGVLQLVALLSFLWPLWDVNAQTWQDKAGSSIVLNTAG